VVLAQLGFIVAFGVLVDALLVRSMLVPALLIDVGPRVWWPSGSERDGRHGLTPEPVPHDACSGATRLSGRPA
jgi:RND superfamily putative drug exporter